MILIALLPTVLSVVLLCMFSNNAAHAFTTPIMKKTRATVSSSTAQSFAPGPLDFDFLDAPSLLLVKADTKSTMVLAKKAAASLSLPNTATAAVNPEVTAQVLNVSSHALMDFPSLYQSATNKKPSKLRIQYAQVAGRLMILGIGMLPHHGFTPEEILVQFFLLHANMKPIIRSIRLWNCINERKCAAECSLEFEELEDSLR